MAERNWHTLECLADGDDCDGGDQGAQTQKVLL